MPPPRRSLSTPRGSRVSRSLPAASSSPSFTFRLSHLLSYSCAGSALALHPWPRLPPNAPDTASRAAGGTPFAQRRRHGVCPAMQTSSGALDASVIKDGSLLCGHVRHRPGRPLCCLSLSSPYLGEGQAGWFLRHLPALKSRGARSQAILSLLALEKSTVQGLTTSRGSAASHSCSLMYSLSAAVPTPSLPSHRQPFWRALGGSSCPRVFFVKCISLFCICAFSAYVSGISIPAQGFASNHIAVGASGVWLLTALSLMAAILSLCLFSRPGKTNISDICHSPDTDQ